jgi:hypothetical protein
MFQIKQLHTEILRLNNLLSGGRPLETILKEVPCACDYPLNLNPNLYYGPAGAELQSTQAATQESQVS